jgi:HSP20 family protein
VPGFAPEEIEVVSNQGTLTIRGEHKVEPELEGSYLRRERRQLPFFRQISLPAETRESEISATFVNGVLSVRIPRVEAPAPTRIKIAVGSAAPALDETPAPASPQAATSPA